MVIENFSTLSQEELKQFAEKLLDKINAESIFSKETNFELDNSTWWGDKDANGERIIGALRANEMTGDLDIALVATDTVSVGVAATWQAPEDDPYDFDDPDKEYPDFSKVFTSEAIIDGYRVTFDVSDYDAVDTEDVQVDDYSYEDSGIGHYECWGATGYDSHPYLECEGVITYAYKVYPTLNVEPIEINK